jgi:uncharacterized protein YyaL (SSP411 family)
MISKSKDGFDQVVQQTKSLFESRLEEIEHQVENIFHLIAEMNKPNSSPQLNQTHARLDPLLEEEDYSDV